MAHTCNPSTRKIEAEISKIQDYLWLHFIESSLAYRVNRVRPYLRKKEK